MASNIHRKIIAIVGPTASGKTGLGVLLAKKFNGEIVSADSRQVYRKLDIGTAKDLEEYGDVKYHMIDIENPRLLKDGANPEEKFTLFDYLPLARVAIEDIFSRGKTPIIVGGTGLYIQALVEGFELERIQNTEYRIQPNVIPADAGIQERLELDSGSQVAVRNDGYNRQQLNKLSVSELQQILREIDSETFEKVDKKNSHRLIRAIEKAQSGEVVTKVEPNFETLQIGLDWSREELNLRIDQRIDERFEGGMLEEVIGLLRSGINPEWLLGLGLEYRIITQFLIYNYPNYSNEIPNIQMIIDQINEKWSMKNEKLESFDAMRQTLKLRSHQYAKRQMTWFKRFPEIVWEREPEDVVLRAKSFLEDK